MKINPDVFEKVAKAGAKLVVVTKYFGAGDTSKILQEVREKSGFLALGENRVEQLAEKKIPREEVHFIGRIQSRKIPEIIKHTSVVHSLENIKHAKLLNTFFVQSLNCASAPGGVCNPAHDVSTITANQPQSIDKPKGSLTTKIETKGSGYKPDPALAREVGKTKKLGVFLQINIAKEPQKAGVLPENFPNFLEEIKKLKNLEILGIASMGTGTFTEQNKRKEFQDLKKIRDKFLPGNLISAGTSRDYEIALEEGIEIVRVGQAVVGV